MIIQVKQGKVEGFENKTVLNGKKYYAFVGIPYAKPPLAELRFKAPVPADPWDGVLEAKTDPNACIQQDEFSPNPKIVGSEDCLYINVFTPEPSLESTTRKAVMVFIHGGGFFSGSSSPNWYSPDFLIEQDIIFVSFNYRLHILGFLNLNIPSCPGNAGMKDQVLALKWIKENIASFGGNPENITIFGESAGGSAIHFHMISPASEGLFNKAIAQSGSAFTPWAYTPDPESTAFQVGEILGFKGTSKEGLFEFFMKQTAEDLCEASTKLHADIKEQYPGKCSTLNFVPSTEKITENAFLPDIPENLVKSAQKIPLICGITDKEGILMYLAQSPNFIQILQRDFSCVVKTNFDLNSAETDELVEKIKEFYFNGEDFSENVMDKLIDLYTSLLFLNFYNSYDYLIQSNKSIYVYEFAYDGHRNFFKGLCERILNRKLKGAAHADELGYLFHSRMMGNELNNLQAQDKKLIENICVMWTNFAKTSNPTTSNSKIEWNECTANNYCFLRIDNELKMINGKLMEDRLKFWKNWTSKFKCYT